MIHSLKDMSSLFHGRPAGGPVGRTGRPAEGPRAGGRGAGRIRIRMEPLPFECCVRLQNQIISNGVFEFRSFLALFRLPAKCPKYHPIFLKFLQQVSFELQHLNSLNLKRQKPSARVERAKSLKARTSILDHLEWSDFHKTRWDYSLRTLSTFCRLTFQF